MGYSFVARTDPEGGREPKTLRHKRTVRRMRQGRKDEKPVTKEEMYG